MSRATNIETKTARLRLKQQGRPHWVKLGGGVGLGYRRSGAAVGTWNVRIADGKGGYREKRIANADDVEAANGKGVMSFAQAREAALRIGRGGGIAAEVAVTTIADAVKAYEEHLSANNRRLGNASRLLYNLPPAMRERPIALLGVEELLKWRNDAKGRMAASSVNRLATILKAALNLAAKKNRTLDVSIWRDGLATLPNATVARNVTLEDESVVQLVYAAYEYGCNFGMLVEALALTGARISQLRRCTVADLSSKYAPEGFARLMIPSSFKGKGNKARPAAVMTYIPASLGDRLRVAAAGRNPRDLLFVKPSGEPWRESNHRHPFREIVQAIGEDPERITSYALRHSHITRMLLKGIAVTVVAKMHDTSPTMIERHYAADIADGIDELIRPTILQIPEKRPDNVIPLRSSDGK